MPETTITGLPTETTITGLPNATTPLVGTERVPMDQAGATTDATTQDIANLAPATNLTFTAATRTLTSSTGEDVVLPVATTTASGLESAADKTKLDSITVDSATLVRKLVRNNSGASIPKGSAVYQTGSSGTTLTVALADASAEATASQTLGLTQETIANNANGYVVAVGLLDGISTATLTEGQIAWLSETAGELTTTRPTQPAHGVICGYCVKQGSSTIGILYVNVTVSTTSTIENGSVSTDKLGGDITTAGKALLDDADAAAQRTTLGAAATPTVYAVGNWICPFDGSVASGSALIANTIALYPFIFRRTVTVDNLGARIITSASGSNLQLAIYGSDVNNKVTGTALAATGSLPAAIATTVSESVEAFTGQAGLIYWMAINSSGAPVMLAPAAAALYMSNILGGPALADALGLGNAATVLRTVAQTFGTWPDLELVTPTVVSASTNSSKGALIAMQVSALP